MWRSTATMCASLRRSSWRSPRSKGDCPAHDRASPHGHVLVLTRETSRKVERITIRRSRFTILPSIVRWRRDLAKTSGCQSCPIGRGLVVAWLSRGRARGRRPRTQGCARDRPSRHVDVRAVRAALPISTAELRGSKRASSMNLSPWQTKKAPCFGRRSECCSKVALLALTGKASDAVNMITSGIAAWRSTGATMWLPLYLSYLGESLCGTRPIR